MIKAIIGLSGQVGDLVMASVAVRQFKAQYPDSHVTFAMGAKYAHVKDLFAGLPGVDAVHAWNGHDNWPSLVDIAFVQAGGFNHVQHPFPQHTRPDWYNHLHYVEETCRMLGIATPIDLQCALGYIPKVVPGGANRITLSLFASGNQLKKTMRLDDMRDLVANLIWRGFTPVQIGSSDLPIEGAQQAQAGSIYDAIDLITSSRLHITIDTAFSWIASAYQHPVVGLYGVTYPDMPPTRIVSHNPVNPNATYLNRPSVKDITVEEILAAAQPYLT